MKMIGNIIVEGNLKEEEILKIRKTARAIILEGNKVYMLFSNLYNDYIFPGGGIKFDENHEEALKRELREELGATSVSVIKPVGYTVELRYGINGNESTYKQISYFYLCEISQMTEPIFNKREILQGLEAKWVEIDEVLKHNYEELSKRNLNDNKGFITVIERENRILSYIKEKMINA